MNMEDHESQGTISKNAAISILANTFYLISRLFLPPFILQHITLSEYGLWSYCFILIGYISMGAFGVSNVYLRYGAVFSAKGKVDEINHLVSTGIVAVSIAALLMVPFIWLFMPWILVLFNIKSDLYPTAFNLLFFTIIAFLFDLVFNAFSSILQSLQRFVLEKIIWTISYTIETIAIVILLWEGYGIYSLFWAYSLRIALAAAMYICACYRIIPGLSINLAYFKKEYLKLFYHFGGIVQISGILGTINRSIEKVFAGIFIGPAAAALLDIGKKLPMTATYLPSSVNAVLLPAASHYHAKEMHQEIHDIYLLGSRWVNLLSGLMMGFMAAFSFPIIKCWLGADPKYEIAAVIMIYFTIASQMDVMTGPGSAVFRSINRPKKELVYPSVQLLLYVISAALYFSFYPATVVSITILVALMTVLSVLIYVFYCNRHFEMSNWDYFVKILLPGLIPYVFGILCYLLMRSWFNSENLSRWDILGLLVIGLTLYLAASVSFIYFILCDRKEKASIKRLLV